MPQRIAILGGTFNPVHWGHLQLATQAHRQVPLDQVIWVPAGHPPHKPQDTTLAPFAQRVAMVERAIAPYPAFTVSTVEQTLPEPSYAIATLQHLQAQSPTAAWYWILGQDSFLSLPQWRDFPALAAACTWLVAPRIGVPPPTPPATVRWHWLRLSPIAISASQIRQRCAQGQSICDWVPKTVQHYIEVNNLYAK